jgi:hypothetical protein
MLNGTTYRKRLVTGLAALACCAALAPAATAVIPDSGGGSKVSTYEQHVYGVGATLSDYMAAQGQPQGVGPATVAKNTGAFDEPVGQPSASQPTSIIVANGGFDWSDAAVGIGIGLGAAALLAAAVGLGRRRVGGLQGA